MFSIIGIVVVIGAIVGGYLMEHGNLKVLIQPAELIIIGGAALGTLLIANPLPVIIKLLKGVAGAFGSEKFSKDRYLDTLKMLNELFVRGRKGGISSLEQDVETPDKSEVFKKYEKVLKDHHILHFICDTLRMAMTGTVSHFDLDQMIELDLEVHHKEVNVPVAALTTVADALPGLGIVAAVLGVVITMGSLGGPPEEIGHKVAAALVGKYWTREFEFSQLPQMMLRSAIYSAIVLFLVAAAAVFSWVLIFGKVPQETAGWIQSAAKDPVSFMLICNVILLIIGTVIDGIPGLIMTVPILLPVATDIYHIDPRHFGVVVVINLVLGLLSPPVGLCFFVAAAVTGAKPGKMFMVTLPFFVISCVLLVLLSLYPSLSLILIK